MTNEGTNEPRRSSSLRTAVRRHPSLILAMTLLFVVLAVVVSSLRAPVYTAQSRLSVGRIDVQTQAIPGIVPATQTLASSYSRFVSATAVLQPLSEATGLSVGELSGRLRGSPVPESPLFFVEATGPSEEAAVELANLASESLAGYVTGRNRTTDNSVALLQEYQEAQVQSAQANEARQIAASAAAGSPGPSTERALREATGTYLAAKLRADTIAERYQESTQGLSSSNQVDIINPATAATSDASSYRLRLVFLAGLIGLIVGLGLAMVAERTGKSSWAFLGLARRRRAVSAPRAAARGSRQAATAQRQAAATARATTAPADRRQAKTATQRRKKGGAAGSASREGAAKRAKSDGSRRDAGPSAARDPEATATADAAAAVDAGIARQSDPSDRAANGLDRPSLRVGPPEAGDARRDRRTDSEGSSAGSDGSSGTSPPTTRADANGGGAAKIAVPDPDETDGGPAVPESGDVTTRPQRVTSAPVAPASARDDQRER